jgi:hypothetical protein
MKKHYKKHYKSAADLLEEAAQSLQAAANVMREMAKGQPTEKWKWGNGPNETFGSVMLPTHLPRFGYEVLELALHAEVAARLFVHGRTPVSPFETALAQGGDA